MGKDSDKYGQGYGGYGQGYGGYGGYGQGYGGYGQGYGGYGQGYGGYGQGYGGYGQGYGGYGQGYGGYGQGYGGYGQGYGGYGRGYGGYGQGYGGYGGYGQGYSGYGHGYGGYGRGYGGYGQGYGGYGQGYGGYGQGYGGFSTNQESLEELIRTEDEFWNVYEKDLAADSLAILTSRLGDQFDIKLKELKDKHKDTAGIKGFMIPPASIQKLDSMLPGLSNKLAKYFQNRAAEIQQALTQASINPNPKDMVDSISESLDRLEDDWNVILLSSNDPQIFCDVVEQFLLQQYLIERNHVVKASMKEQTGVVAENRQSLRFSAKNVQQKFFELKDLEQSIQNIRRKPQ